jgi:LAGLIDADG endonuclease
VLIKKIILQKKEEVLFNRVKNVLECGFIYKHSKRNIKDINNKMIPLFNEHKIIGIKSLDYLDFCKVVEIINRKDHLTLEGSEKIKLIKFGMNKGRIL